MEQKKFAQDLVDFIYESPTAFQAVETSKKLLQENGFRELILNEKWNVEVNGRYYVTKNSSALVAFTVNSQDVEKEGFRIVGSHSDSPTFRIKPKAEMVVEGTYLKLNTECYGGPILNTWLDRPLAIAGRVVLKGENALRPVEKMVNIKKPICIIPNVAIHMNRTVNEGYALNKQKDMLPLVGLINENLEKDNFLLKQLAKELDVELEEIIDFDLFLYEFEKGSLIGPNEEFISTGRLDNLSMAHSSLHALIDANGSKGVNVVAVFDNEEVGSSTKQGADSNMLINILERICLSLQKSREEFFSAIYSSFIISADLAHAVHPNMVDKHDPTSRPVMGKGPVIKINANQAYTSDAQSISVYKSICKEAGVNYQEFVNRSDERGGSTIGPISSTHLDIPSVDVGSPILAMHSIRELGNVEDHYNIYKTFNKFYEI
ncbi:M18 family aminopeptidase [Romboutsia lituseburensis]|uniref:M18 family aminopeptidase n=1 Tax=Romboutsia lituseburensis DSM 797 TaxID=1121325 RepID=A0A1G9QYJ5_9FIRM|nr:M18 family aminopeptidase [Romboutsia lituseburensis]CEH35816.1 Aspartyl aminopeptidase 4 [Romboutsia lituseburensis]SDM16112.1 aspartyl aminopeptidase [Romboutsia lituseburensis DSM 797]